MMHSMTGFGRGESAAAGGTFTVEISSVNRKQLEIRFSLPREFAMLEPELRKQIAGRISRGSVNVRVVFNAGRSAAAGTVRINTGLLDELLAAAHDAAVRAGIEPVIDPATLLNVPGVIEAPEIDGGEPELAAALKEALDRALEQFIAMRRAEGEELAADFAARTGRLKALLDRIEPLAAAVPAAIKGKLLEKLSADRIPVDLNDERLLKEVLFYADKSDVTEEITRLRSHFVQFEKFTGGGEAGRSLDFLMQEMFREITTLANKAGSGEIAPLAVAFKAELEKLREQIQNIE